MGNKMCTCNEEKIIDDEDLELDKEEELDIHKEEKMEYRKKGKEQFYDSLNEGGAKKVEQGHEEQKTDTKTSPFKSQTKDSSSTKLARQQIRASPQNAFGSSGIKKNASSMLSKNCEDESPPKEDTKQILWVPLPEVEFIHFEGELQKYRPGLSTYYIPRWCQTTLGSFEYYKTHWDANCWLSKPLMRIPYKCVQAVKRVQVDVPSLLREPEFKKNFKYFTKPSLLQNYPYQFEIFLRSEVDIAVLTKNIDFSAYETRGSGTHLWKHRNDSAFIQPSLKNSRISNYQNSVVKDFSQDPNLQQQKMVQVAFDSPPKSSQRNLSLLDKPKVLPGHLMRSPSAFRDEYNKSREYSPENILQKVSRELSCSLEKKMEEEVVEEDEIFFQNKAERDNYRKFLREKKKTMFAIRSNGPEPRYSEKPNRSVAKCTAWTKRETEWFHAENRFLFACTDELQCNKWVAVLNWLIVASNN